jgi:hypothetical protein
MKRLSLPLLLVLATAGGSMLAGCGSGGTRTITESNSSSTSGSSSSPPAGGATAPASPTTNGAKGTSNGGTQAPRGTRTASGPTFVAPAAGGGLGAAVAELGSRGFSALNTSDYHADQTLRVLVGARQGSADAHVQQAFFFVAGRYLGTDTSQPSGQVQVVGQSDTEVTLSYALYRHGDPLCCPSGGRAQVHYALDNGKLAPLDPIPSATARQ